MIDFIGFTAGVFTSINIIPQLIQSIKTKKVEDISLMTYVIYDLGLILWVTYGYLIHSWPVTIMDGFACISSLVMTYIKVKYDNRETRSIV
jgi:MtN3 and saliva related transmembrane protein